MQQSHQLAIPKDHSVTALLEMESAFTFSILQEEKQMHKPFRKLLSVGEDRLRDVEFLNLDADVVLLKEALAHLSCRDHKIIEHRTSRSTVPL